MELDFAGLAIVRVAIAVNIWEYGNKYWQLLFRLGASSSIKYTNMHVFVHKKMTKYLCTTKNTRYYVVKK
jgi:hypothetical protein